MVRHGDLLVYKIDTLPKGLSKRNEPVLAYGETTGNAHRVQGNVSVFEDISGGVYFDATSPVILTHEEHKPIRLDVGVYKVTRKREYSPRENRVVTD